MRGDIAVLSSQNEYIPVVVQASALPGYRVKACFSDGRVTVMDISAKITKGVFQKIASPDVFTETLTVMNDTACWDLSGKRDPADCIDLDPITLYAAPNENRA